MTETTKQLNEDTMDRLASLSEQINTSKGFGMMGLLESQTQQAQEVAQPVAQPVASHSAEVDAEKIAQYLEPINSSLRATSETFKNEIGSLRNEVSSLRHAPQQTAQEEVGEVDPVTQKLGQIERGLVQSRLNNAWERARNSYNAAKQKYGDDFDYKEDDLKSTWQQHIGANVQAAEGTNWDVYFQQQYNDRRAPKLEQRLKTLESELAKQKSAAVDPMANMAAMPRGNRNGAPMPAAGGGVNDFDEDVYRRASARMGKRIGSFAGFNRFLHDEQTKKLLRTAG